MNQVWKDSEKAYIKDNADRLKDRELAAELTKITGRQVTIQAVRKQRQKLGIQKVRGRGLCGVVQKDTVPTTSHQIAHAIPVAQPVNP